MSAASETAQTIRVMVAVDIDELREWAGRHADAAPPEEATR